MILWKTKEVRDTRSFAVYSSHRYVLELTISKKYGFDVSWTCQGRRKDDTSAWHAFYASDSTGFSINDCWSWGSMHVYYDGPHCFYSVGPIHFHWNDWDCKKCDEER
jgi:hypothetical protein